MNQFQLGIILLSVHILAFLILKPKIKTDNYNLPIYKNNEIDTPKIKSDSSLYKIKKSDNPLFGTLNLTTYQSYLPQKRNKIEYTKTFFYYGDTFNTGKQIVGISSGISIYQIIKLTGFTTYSITTSNKPLNYGVRVGITPF